MYIFLYCGFTNKAYYWEFVVLARKVTVNIVLLVSDKATVQGLLFLFVFTSCSLLHFHVHPYRENFLNRAEGTIPDDSCAVL